LRNYGPHFVNGNRVAPPFPDGMQTAVFGEGCFWGAERGFWELAGVYSTAVVYAGGYTPNPAYNEVCSGRTGYCGLGGTGVACPVGLNIKRDAQPPRAFFARAAAAC
jgi:hypothetical protein